jgi:hypothetical protein
VSVPQVPLSGPPDVPSQRTRGLGGCLATFLVLVGIVLLLPGLCSLVFIGMLGSGGGSVAALWFVCFLIGVVGIIMIQYAIKNR